jgi:hypothetical protein
MNSNAVGMPLSRVPSSDTVGIASSPWLLACTSIPSAADQRRLVGSVFPIVSQGRSRLPDHAAGPRLRDLVLVGQIARGGSLLVGGPPLFFSDILEHRLIQKKLGYQPLESLDLDLKLATAPIGVDLCGVMPLSPAVVGGLGDAELTTEVGDGHSLGQVAVDVLQQPSHFVVGPLLAYGSLPVQVYRGTPSSSGPSSGGHSNRSSAPVSIRLRPNHDELHRQGDGV